MSEQGQGLVEQLPKVEQHIHLVVSVRTETLLWLVAENGIQSDDLADPDGVRRLFQFRDFEHFIDCYTVVMRCIREEKQFERVVYEMLEDEARQNVRYVEASFSAPDHTRMGLDYFEMLKAINRGIDRAGTDFSVECKLKIDFVRDYGPKIAMTHLDLIAEYGRNVVAIDIGGREHIRSAKEFADVYRRAKKMGLHLTAHAGEASGPESIWAALTHLRVERVGHGVAAKDDPRLVEYLLNNNIAVEMCPISNVRTKVVGNIRSHPIRPFFDRGLMVTVNSDDPTMFETSMNNEYRTLHDELGFTIPELFRLSLNGIDSSFLEEDRRRSLKRSFYESYDRLSR